MVNFNDVIGIFIEHLKAWHRLDIYGNDLTHGHGKRIFEVLIDHIIWYG